MRHFFPLVCSKIKPMPGSAALGAASVASSMGGVSGRPVFPSSAWGPELKKCSMLSRQVSRPPSNLGMTVPRPLPAARNFPASSGLPMVADKPIRRGEQPARAHSRSMRQKVCRPRSPRKREWISSMTMNRRSPKREGISMCLLMSRLSRDSGVICKIPAGLRSSFRFWVWGASPCQRVTGMPASSHSSPSRPNWSLMRALRGAIYSTPTVAEGFSSSRLRMGKKAASVLPEAVEAVKSTFSSVLKMASPAAFCTARRLCQPER